MLLSKGCAVVSADEKAIVIRHPNVTEIPFTKNADDKLYLWATRDMNSTDSAPSCAFLAESGGITTTRATTNGERLFVDISGPYAQSAGRNKL
jgi:hypothetical protein